MSCGCDPIGLPNVFGHMSMCACARMRLCVHVCMILHVCVCMCMCMYVCVCVRACVRACVPVLGLICVEHMPVLSLLCVWPNITW